MELVPATWHLYPPMGLLVQTPAPLKADLCAPPASSKWRQHPVSTAIFVVSCLATVVVLLDLVIAGNSPTTHPASVTIAANTTATTPTAALRLDDAASSTGDPPSTQLREMLALLLLILVGAGAYLMQRRAQSTTPTEIKICGQEGPKPVCLTVVPAPL